MAVLLRRGALSRARSRSAEDLTLSTQEVSRLAPVPALSLMGLADLAEPALRN